MKRKRVAHSRSATRQPEQALTLKQIEERLTLLLLLLQHNIEQVLRHKARR